MIKNRSVLLFVALLGCHVPAITAVARGAPVARWQVGDGAWEDAAKWGGTLPPVNAVASINGKSHVAINQAEAALSRVELGTDRNAVATLTMTGGSLAATDFIRLGEHPGSRARFVFRGGTILTTAVAIGGMNEGEVENPQCHAEMEIQGGNLLARYLMLGYRIGSTARLRMSGSKAQRLLVLNAIDCAIPTGKIGSTTELVFEIDTEGVTPIVLWNKNDAIRLARKDRAGKCTLQVGLLAAPPRGDVVLMSSFKPCVGQFEGLPEGALIRAKHADQTYEWRLTYRGGTSQCDITLTDPHIVTADGGKQPYTGGRPARALKIDSAVEIKQAWVKLYAQADRVAPPLGTGTRAFPGAEGYGAYAQGGRGGCVLFVTNLNDSGPGSLRQAIDSKGPRTVIFRVGGVIELKKPLQIREPFITIAGQTAPGDGICLKGAPDTLTLTNTHDVIVRYLRIRTGYIGDNDANEGDCISCYSAENFIIDHCSLSWGSDETLSCTQTCDRYTVQWCLIAEGLNYHRHSMGSILGGDRSTWHHNLYAHCRTRNPRFAGLCRCDFRNNVIYNWGDTCGYGEFRSLNYVNNFVKPGSSTTQKPPRFLQGESVIMPGDLFLAGNVLEGSADASRDNRLGTGYSTDVFAMAPFAAPPVETQSATAAYELVLEKVGALVPRRDSTDVRILADVRKRTGTIVRYEKDLGAWPSYGGGQAPLDSDGDGIPDDWERAHGLNPNDPSDANQLNADGYTNLEYYLNSLVPAAKPSPP